MIRANRWLLSAALVIAACGTPTPSDIKIKPIVEETPVEKVTVSISPATATLEAEATHQFKATVKGNANTAVAWSVEESEGGSVDADGLYTAPAEAGTYHVVATSKADTTVSAKATVTVSALPIVSVAVGPVTTTLLEGETVQLTATVTNANDTSVTWAATGGSVNTTGLFTADGGGGTFTVTATSNEDNSKSASATVHVATVLINQRAVQIYPGDTTDFTATVLGTFNPVYWTATGGEINGGGSYYSGEITGTFTVTATEPLTGAQDTVDVVLLTPTFDVDLVPLSATVETGATESFSATVAGSAFGNPVTWYTTGGSVSLTGVYTAPVTPGIYKVVAVSKDDTLRRRSAEVTVIAADPIVSITPLTASLEINASTSFAVSVTNSIWNQFTVELVETEGDRGALDVGPTTVLTGSQNVAFQSFGTTGTAQVLVKTLNQNPQRTATATLTVNVPQPILTMTPLAPSVETEATQTFAISVTNTQYDSFTVTAQPGDSYLSATAGVGSQNIVYTAPVTAGDYTVTATAVSDETITITRTITVFAADPVLTLSAPAVTMVTTDTYDFDVEVSNVIAAHQGVNWSVDGVDGGTIDANGLYTPPTTAGTYLVRATSTAQPGVSAEATVYVFTPACPATSRVYTYWDGDRKEKQGVVRFEYAAQSTYSTWHTYGEFAPELQGPAANVTGAVVYSGPGADNAWQTADDEVGTYYRISYGTNSKETGYAQFVSGADDLWFTADDAVTAGTEVSYIGADVDEIYSYGWPGDDGVQDEERTSRAKFTWANIGFTYCCYFGTTKYKLTKIQYFVAATDGTINTGDDYEETHEVFNFATNAYDFSNYYHWDFRSLKMSATNANLRFEYVYPTHWADVELDTRPLKMKYYDANSEVYQVGDWTYSGSIPILAKVFNATEDVVTQQVSLYTCPN